MRNTDLAKRGIEPIPIAGDPRSKIRWGGGLAPNPVDVQPVSAASVQWNNDYSIGIEKIDSEHLAIIAMLDDIRCCKSVDGIKELFSDIVQCLEYHFAHEEHIQLLGNYPQYEVHCNEHQKMFRRIKAIGRIHLAPRSARRHPDEVAGRVYRLTRDCLIRHVLKADKAMGDFLLGL